MPRSRFSVVLAVLLLSISLQAQLNKFNFPAGTPEDQALQAISAEADEQKKPAMYEDFLQKFSANPPAVAYGNWQLAQYYRTAGDLPKAEEYADKAIVSAPQNLEILATAEGIAQQAKDNGKIIQYCMQAGDIYNVIGDSAQDEKQAAKSSHDFFEASAFNAIAGEPDARKRVAYIKLFAAAFPNSTFDGQITPLAMVAFSQLKDTPQLISYGEKSLATDPDNLPVLLLLANAYVDDPKPGSVAKAVIYAQKAILLAKAGAPDADRTHKISAGAAHSTLGYAYMKQDKTLASVPELKSACGLLKGQDDQSYAAAMYRLGFAYAKLTRLAEAHEVLMEAVKIPGPVQSMSRDLLAKVDAARAKGR